MTQTVSVFSGVVVVLRNVLFALGVLAAIAAGIAWGVRTRRLGPFTWAGRFARRWVDPLLAPVERLLVRTGVHPTSVPWWGLVLLLLASALLLSAVEALGGVYVQMIWVAGHPAQAPVLVLSWAFMLLRLALIVRVLVSWVPASPYAWWVRWSYRLTEWMLRPLRSVVPPFGAIDVTPVIAYFLLWVLQMLLHIP